VQGRGRRQADESSKLQVRPIGVLLQLSEQRYVNFIKLNGHSTKY
jgi:hypothetical protein